MRRALTTLPGAYLAAAAFTAAAVLLRGLLDPWLDDSQPLVTVYAAVALSVWLGGYRPALVAVVLGYLACDYFFIEPVGALGLTDVRGWVGFLIYLLSCGVILAFGEGMRRERRRSDAERARLRQSDEFHQAIAELAADFAWTARVEPGGAVVTEAVTDGFTRLLGYTLDELDAAGGWSVLLHPDDLSDAQKAIARALAGHPISGEHRQITKDGRTLWVSYTTRPVLDGTGRVVRLNGGSRDVTAERLAADAARAARDRLEMVLSRISDQFFILDRQWRYVYLNDRVAEVTGRRKEELAGRVIWEVFPEVVGTDFAREVRRAVAEQRPARFEVHYPPVGRWFENHLSPSPEGLAVLVADVTERKQAEALLVEHNRVLERVAAGAARDDCLAALCAAVPRLCPGTRAWVLLADEPRRGLPGAVVPAEPAALGGAALEEQALGTCGAAACRGEAVGCPDIAADERWAPAWRELCLAHGIRACHSAPIPSPEGRPAGSVMLGFDRPRGPTPWELRLAELATQLASIVLERDRATEALAASEERFRTLAQAVPSIVWTAAPDGTITWVNDRWLRYCGITAEQNARGWPERVLHPDDHDRCVARWSHALATGEEYEVEVRNRRHDGEYRWFVTRALPRRDAEGRVVGWFGVTTDIHDRKQAEEALREAHRRKDEFLALLGHELRNPLGPIRNAVEVLERVGADGAAAGQARAMIARQAGHMARLIDDLLDVSRIARGKVRLKKERCDLSAIVRDAAEDYRMSLEAGGLKLSVELPAGPLWVEGDPTRLTQVVGNVLHNAQKFTDAGGEVAVRVEGCPRGARVVVRDTGIGMTPETLGRVFETFSQADGSLERSRGGLGLGLALVKGLVELHGGEARAGSGGVGRGSEITLELPLALGAAPPRREAAASGGRRPRRVLVIEDNADAAESLATLLRLTGHAVELAATGPAGVEAARRFRPEVVFSDIGLPGMDGYAVARALRREPGLEGAYLVALTGYGQEEDHRRARDAGFDVHLIKPADFATVQRLLGAAGAR